LLEALIQGLLCGVPVCCGHMAGHAYVRGYVTM